MAGINFNKAQFKAAYGLPSQIPAAKAPEVVVCGRSNVGKSSLINKLLGRKALAKVSQKPGKTATINFYDVDGVYLVDLPGYGFAKVGQAERKRWADLIAGYFDQDRSFNLVVCLVDIRHEPQKLDREMVAFLKERELPFVIALTKADKISAQKARNAKLRVAEDLGVDTDDIYVTSSAKGTGIRELQARISEDTLEEG